MDRTDINWLRGQSCFEGPTCEGVARVTGHAGLFVVARTVTDRATLAAFADRVGPGEVLVSVTDELLPELSGPC